MKHILKNEDVLAEIAEKLQKNDSDTRIEGFGELKFSLKKDELTEVLFTISKEEMAPYLKNFQVEFTKIYVGE